MIKGVKYLGFVSTSYLREEFRLSTMRTQFQKPSSWILFGTFCLDRGKMDLAVSCLSGANAEPDSNSSLTD